MRLSIKTCTLDMPFAAMLDFCVAQGVQAVEIGTGNWSGAPHIDLDELLGSETARQRWMDQLRRRDIALCALNCSGNPLAFQKDWEVTEKTFRLAKLLGVEKIVMMSGLPGGCPEDRTPTWIVTSWGMRASSISLRRNSYSGSDAAGKPTSISLKPIFTSIWKNSSFSSRLMGTIRA